jgi:hypothetical protein
LNREGAKSAKEDKRQKPMLKIFENPKCFLRDLRVFAVKKGFEV